MNEDQINKLVDIILDLAKAAAIEITSQESYTFNAKLVARERLKEVFNLT